MLLVLVSTIGFEHLLVDPVAQRGGMGYALANDGYSLLYNPAGLAGADRTYFTASYLNYIGGTHFGFLGWEKPALGLGLRYFNAGTMKKTDALGNEYGTFGANFLDLCVGKGLRIRDVDCGITARFQYAQIDSLYALGAGLDIGVMYALSASGITFGAAAKNLGQGFKAFVSENDMMPYEITVAAAKQFPDQSWIALDIVKPALTGIGVRVGGEFRLFDAFGLVVSYSSLLSDMRTQTGLDIITGTTLGFNFRRDQLTIAYTYAPYFVLGDGHRLSVRFGG